MMIIVNYIITGVTQFWACRLLVDHSELFYKGGHILIIHIGMVLLYGVGYA